jgi:hypothetical protein
MKDVPLTVVSVLTITITTVTLVGGFVWLALAGVDTTGYVLFCAGPAASAAVGLVLSHKVGNVGDVVKQVERQTNGMAIARVVSLDDHLTAQDFTAAQVATAALDRAQPPSEPLVGPPRVVPSDGP